MAPHTGVARQPPAKTTMTAIQVKVRSVLSRTMRSAAFVTGASTGIGAAIAVAFARQGWDVAMSATRQERLADTAREVENIGGRAVRVTLDLRSLAGMEAAVAEVFKAFGHLDALVNNAGVTIRKPALDVTIEDWETVMQTNVRGTFFLCQHVGRRLAAECAPASIITIASTHGVVGLPNRVIYGMSKAALIQMTRMLAIEWADYGIRVNAIAPGTVDTPSREHALADPEARRMMLDRIPLRRFATAAEVADAVCFLAGPGAAYMTGQTLVFDGGLTAC